MFSEDVVGTRDATLDALAWCRRENVLKLAEFISLRPTRMICMGTPTVLLASGSNARGQLANGTIDDSHRFSPCNFVGCLPGKLPPDTRQIVNIASGSNHVLALLERQNETGYIQRELWGCGDGSKGQLGPSYIGQKPEACDISRSIFRPLDLPLQECGLEGYACRLVASAWETSYVVLSSDGKGDVVLCMGANDYGDLGISESTKGKETIKHLNVVALDHIVSRGGHLDNSRLCVKSLNAGPHHVIIHVRCPVISAETSHERFTIGWGSSRHGQLGSVSTAYPTAISSIPRIIFDESIPSRGSVVSSSLGNQHSVFLHTSGCMSHLGSNKKGQLQELTTLRHVQSVSCTWNGTYAVVRSSDSHYTIFATGSHAKGQLGRMMTSSAEWASTILPLDPVFFPFESSSRRLLGIASGSEHVLALFATEDDTEVWGWGWNEHGNLGTGTIEDIRLPTIIWPRSFGGDEILGRAVGIWAGCGTSWIAIKHYD
jgi:protein ATS1